MVNADSKQYCLGVFAKYWEPGRVKTRLAKSIGEAKAAEIYKTFVETLISRFGSTKDRQSVLAFSPDNRLADFQELIRQTIEAEDAWTFESQGDGDLGSRLQQFFAAMLHRYARVVVIGTDSPSLPSSYLDQAHRLLDSHEVVLGPSEDGGYYLVAAHGKVPPVFSGIDWSTDQVWSQTIARLQEHRVKFGVLPTWYDVDTIDDLKRLQTEPSG